MIEDEQLTKGMITMQKLKLTVKNVYGKELTQDQVVFEFNYFPDGHLPQSWCGVWAIAKYNDFVGDDCIGECTYESMDAFMEVGGYYQSMKEQALKNLKDKINENN